MRKGAAKTILDRIDVIQAYVDGKKIQFKHETSSTWSTFNSDNPAIDIESCEWRVAPEPREFWIEFRQARSTVVHYEDPAWICEDSEYVHVREVLDD